MSPRRPEIVRAALEAWNADDVRALHALMAADGRIVPLRAALEDVVYAGPNAARDFQAGAMNAWSELIVDIEDIRELEDERVLAIGRLQATARDTGAAVEQRVGWIVTFDGERIAEFRTYPSAQAAREAAGLTE